LQQKTLEKFDLSYGHEQKKVTIQIDKKLAVQAKQIKEAQAQELYDQLVEGLEDYVKKYLPLKAVEMYNKTKVEFGEEIQPKDDSLVF
jgi:hypothetical protein